MTEINSQNVFLADIKLTDRKRPADPEKIMSLASSMAEVGQLQAIGITDSHELVFGLHRYEAARKLGWKTIRVHRVKSDKLITRLAQLDENLCRNELTTLQRAKWLQEREEIQEKLGKRAKSGGSGKRTTNPETGETVSPLTVADRAAEVGMEKRSFQQHLQIANQLDPEVSEALEDTKIGKVADSTTQLLQLSNMSPDDQRRVISMIQNEEARDVRDASRKLRRVQLGSLPLPEGVYNLLTSDLPWQFDDDGARGSAENHYPTMTLEEMLAMDFGQLHANNVVHFLWLTKHHYEEATALYKAWGLEYKTEIIWEKPNIGTGTWSRGKHEKIWVLSRGSDMTPSYVPDSVQHWSAPPEHSRKPPEFYEMVDRMYPQLRKRLELFGRSPREGYVVYGNETDKFDDQTAAAPLMEPEYSHV